MRYKIIFLWIVSVMGAMILSLSLGMICVFRATCIVGNLDIPLIAFISSIAWLITPPFPILPGLILGLFQWQLLRQYAFLPKSWIWATLLAVGLGPVLGIPLMWLLPDDLFPLNTNYDHYGYIALVTAVTVGVIQGYLLRDKITLWLWILVHIACGYLGGILMVDNWSYKYADSINALVQAAILVGIYALLSGWLIANAISGSRKKKHI